MFEIIVPILFAVLTLLTFIVLVKIAEAQADQESNATQKAAEAELTERTKKAEADKIEAMHQTEAEKALAEAEKVKIVANAEDNTVG